MLVGSERTGSAVTSRDVTLATGETVNKAQAKSNT